jgi:hypothetical protein
MKKVDLNICKKGDILISKHGAILKYLEPLPEEHYYDHRIEYLCLDGVLNEGQLGSGTRNNDGTVFKNKHLDTDHDIVSIIPLETFKKLYL